MMTAKELTKEQHEKLMARFIEMRLPGSEAGTRVALVIATAEKRNLDPWPLCEDLFFSDDYDAAAKRFIQKYASN